MDHYLRRWQQPGGAIAAVVLALCPLAGHGFDVKLAWDPNPPDDGVLQYSLYIDYGTGVKLLEVLLPCESPDYTVRELNPGVVYKFYVTAVSAWGESEPSNIVIIGGSLPDQRRSIRRGNHAPLRRQPKLESRDSRGLSF